MVDLASGLGCIGSLAGVFTNKETTVWVVFWMDLDEKKGEEGITLRFY